jgi:hypothetical protein
MSRVSGELETISVERNRWDRLKGVIVFIENIDVITMASLLHHMGESWLALTDETDP